MSEDEITVTVTGGTRDERIDAIEGAQASIDDGRWVEAQYSAPFSGNQTSLTFRRADPKKMFLDMSVQACADRHDAGRRRILQRIKDGDVSASMSGIEYYVGDFHELGAKGDWGAIEVGMTWNGQTHISRPNWREEYKQWLETGTTA